MARGAAKQRAQRARPKPAPNPRKRSGASRGGYGAIEQAMFFPRLRRQAKWVFVFLAAVFAIGFVFFGVGSGSTGVSDILKGNFNIFGGGSSTSTAVSNAQKRVKKAPSDPQAWKALAVAYQQQKGKDQQANDAYLRYLHLRPKDYDALLQVAGFYSTRGDRSFRAGLALQGQGPITPDAAYGIGPASPLAQILGRDQISQALSQQASTTFQQATAAYRQAEPYYRRATKLRPDDQFTLFEYARTADLAGDSSSALVGYRAFLKKSAPGDPTTAQVRQRIAQLSLTVPTQRRR